MHVLRFPPSWNSAAVCSGLIACCGAEKRRYRWQQVLCFGLATVLGSNLFGVQTALSQSSAERAADRPGADRLIVQTVVGTGLAKINNLSAPQATNVGNPFGVAVGPDEMVYICEVANHRLLRWSPKGGEIVVVGGTGQPGYAGDGGVATAALLNEPYEVRFDHVGNLYLVEMQNHVVRRIDHAQGTIETIAGNGVAGFGGDGGRATDASLNRPHSIALDGQGSLYIADIGNHRIRRVDLQRGTIETFAGNEQKRLPHNGQPVRGTPVLGPRALFVQDNLLWVALREGHSVWKINLNHPKWIHVAGTGDRGYSGDGGYAKQATFNGPKGIVVGPSGNVFVVDTENHVVRKIDVANDPPIITTIAGNGQRGYNGERILADQASMNRPHGIDIDGDGTIYVGDSANHRVRRIRNGNDQ